MISMIYPSFEMNENESEMQEKTVGQRVGGMNERALYSIQLSPY